MPTARRTGIPRTAPARKLGPHKYHLIFGWSDWHLDESVNLLAADGSGLVNRFGRAIAEERVSQLIQSCVQVFGMYVQPNDVRPALTIWLGGDFITGAIHEESRTVTWCSPTQAMRFAREQISRALSEVVSACRPSRLDIVCSVGNHERTTPKSQVSVPAGFSLATGLYEHLAERHDSAWRKAGIPGVWVPPPDEGPISYVPLSFGKLGRFLHGDARGFKYQGGVGGLGVPLNRFLGRANTEPGAAGAITVLGHYHTFGWHENARAVTNGSLIGYNGYARALGCAFEYPCQVAVVLSRHGNMGPIAVHKLMCG